MSDATQLKRTLASTQNTLPSIQASASAMMRFYDRSPPIAVSTWRSTLESCPLPQLLPLLYVANEVLQNSKRNRGTKFLEAFSPILVESLRLVCKRGGDVQLTEKVRRTAKIWGDRSVYSPRFVGDLLRKLEEYRTMRTVVAPPPVVVDEPPPEDNRFSPLAAVPDVDESMQEEEEPSRREPQVIHVDDDDDSDDASMGSNNASTFQTKSSLLLTNLRVDKSAVEQSSSTTTSTFGLKRRRSEQDKQRGNSSKKKKSATKKRRNSLNAKPKTTISASGFVELVSELSQAESKFQLVKMSWNAITSSEHFTSTEEVEQVGDELMDVYKEVGTMLDSLEKKKQDMYDLADKKHDIELEMERYLKWMVGLVTVDDNEMKMCLELEEQMELMKELHGHAKAMRDEKRRKEAEEKAIAEEERRKKEEEEERRRSLENIREETGKKGEGMVWNKTAREWQQLPDVTEESWRD